jgi:AcrR family transcriptional regulator
MFLSELADLVLEREEVLLWKRERRQLSESEQEAVRLKLNDILRQTVQALGLENREDAELRAWGVLGVYSSVAPTRRRVDDAAAKRTLQSMAANLLTCNLDGAATTNGIPVAAQRRPPGRRERILATATRLFHAQSYHAVGIEEIAAESDTAIATFYQYFNGKAELLQAVLNRGAEGLHYVTNHRLPSATTPQEAVDVIACTLIELALGPHQPILGILAAT